MTIEVYTYNRILKELGPGIRVVAVSKTKPPADIKALYDLGQRDFGENYVQELTEKQRQLPADILWHFIGHLQSNKIKQIISFVHLIHGVDSLRLLKEIDKQAGAKGRVVDVLLQVHIAREETKFGLDAGELADIMTMVRSTGTPPIAALPDHNATASNIGRALARPLPNVRVHGLMGMASFTEDPATVRAEFRELRKLFDQYFPIAHPDPGIPMIAPGNPPRLSMGMSADYKIAVEEGSNMVRIGSLIFGKRD